MEYNKKYTKLNKKTINAVRKAILEKRIFRVNSVERLEILDTLLSELSEIYGVDKPRLAVTTINEGYYDLMTNTIYLSNKLSLVTLLHEFKHGLQHLKHLQNSENIARGWSISLFSLASKKHFERAINKNLIIHQKEV